MNNVVKLGKKLILLILLTLLTACQTVQKSKQDIFDNKQTTPSEQRAIKLTEVDKVNELSAPVIDLLAQAKQQQARGDNAAAITTIERAIRIAPRSPESYYQLAMLHFQQKNYAQARSLAQKTLTLGAVDKLRQQALKLIQIASESLK